MWADQFSSINLAHINAGLCMKITWKLHCLILNDFLPLTPGAGRHSHGHLTSTTYMLTTTAGECLCGNALLNVPLGVIFFFVVEIWVITFLAFLCLTTDHNLFCLISHSPFDFLCFVLTLVMKAAIGLCTWKRW